MSSLQSWRVRCRHSSRKRLPSDRFHCLRSPLTHDRPGYAPPRRPRTGTDPVEAGPGCGCKGRREYPDSEMLRRIPGHSQSGIRLMVQWGLAKSMFYPLWIIRLIQAGLIIGCTSIGGMTGFTGAVRQGARVARGLALPRLQNGGCSGRPDLDRSTGYGPRAPRSRHVWGRGAGADGQFIHINGELLIHQRKIFHPNDINSGYFVLPWRRF